MIYGSCHGIPYPSNLWKIIKSSAVIHVDPRCNRPVSRIKHQIIVNTELIEVRLFSKQTLFLAFHITHMTKIIHYIDYQIVTRLGTNDISLNLEWKQIVK